MAEAPFSDEDSVPSIKFFSPSPPEESNGAPHETTFKSIMNEDNLVPSQIHYSREKLINEQIEHQISRSLDQLSTKSEQNSGDESDGDRFRKKIRVGNHYQARIPKFLSDVKEYINEDELLWDPFTMEPSNVESFLKRISSITKLVLPVGNHLRDDEQALHILQKNRHDVENALRILSTNTPQPQDKISVWTEEECRNFEKGLLDFGKNFFLIQKYKLNTRHVGELVQFYYLWKKTERYDLFTNRMRTGKKKYALNPGISDLMCRYLGTQSMGADVQFIITENRKDVPQNNSQY